MEPACLLNMNILPTPKIPYKPTIQPDAGQDTTKKPSADEGSKSKSLVTRLLERLPEIDRFFSVQKKIGEGTFSNVFVATTKTLAERKKFAIKHLTPTSHPSRIIQEMKCLKDIGGRDNVVGLELCFRNRDAVAFVMPYFPHDSFASYVTEMKAEEMQVYMKNLLIALQRVHSFNIIHRDVKPSNFLYNRKERRFLLVDFGLSHQVESILQATNDANIIIKNDRKRVLDPFEKEACAIESKRPVLHSLSNNVPKRNGERLGKLSLKKKSPPFKENSPMSKNLTFSRNISQVKRNLQFGNITSEAKKEFIPLLNEKFDRALSKESASSFAFNKPGSSFYRIQNSQIKSQFSIGAGTAARNSVFRKPLVKTHSSLPKECECDTKPRICNYCLVRKPMQAPRAGTPGYRSPEVLLKYPHQTTAVDVWSAGVIMLSILSGSYPFFRAPDDISALMEMITVFGIDEFKITARKLGRNLLCNEPRKPLNIKKLCVRLRKRKKTEAIEEATNFSTCRHCLQKIMPNEGCLCDDSAIETVPNDCSSDSVFPDEAYDLLSKLLTVDPEKRFTAKDAMEHPFFKLDFIKPDY